MRLGGSDLARGPTVRTVFGAALLLHAVVALAALPVAPLALVHGSVPDAAQMTNATDESDGGTMHQTPCQGCTLVRVAGHPPAGFASYAILEPIAVPSPADASDAPAPIRGSPLGGRAPPLG
jgi:hypothetical protein